MKKQERKFDKIYVDVMSKLKKGESSPNVDIELAEQGECGGPASCGPAPMGPAMPAPAIPPASEPMPIKEPCISVGKVHPEKYPMMGVPVFGLWSRNPYLKKKKKKSKKKK